MGSREVQITPASTTIVAGLISSLEGFTYVNDILERDRTSKFF